MIAFLFYGGMLLTVLPREPGVSWQAHLGGAIAGVVSRVRCSGARDPPSPRKRYSWEIEEELAAEAARIEREQFEPPRRATCRCCGSARRKSAAWCCASRRARGP